MSRKAAPVSKEQKPNRGGDVMSYTITVEDGERPTVLKQSNTGMSAAFDALRNRLE